MHTCALICRAFVGNVVQTDQVRNSGSTLECASLTAIGFNACTVTLAQRLLTPPEGDGGLGFASGGAKFL
jgi:hypothetical protein